MNKEVNELNKVLVLGGNGFIGRNIIKVLRESGFKTGVYDIYVNGDVDQYEGDILNDPNFETVVGKYDSLIYLISNTSVGKSMTLPNEVYSKDIPMVIKTLETCLKLGKKRVVFASSGGTIYGKNKGASSKESERENPINNYAICKLACEKIFLSYNEIHKMENVILRISNPYGIGQNPANGVGAITFFLNQVLQGERVSVFGDGTISRDFIDVKSVAIAFQTAIEWNFDRQVEPVFNVGSGKEITLNKIIELIESTLGVNVDVVNLPEREFDVKVNVLDMSKSAEILGFVPEENQIELIKEYILYVHSCLVT